MYGLYSRPEVTFLWRFRGATPPPEQFPSMLWNGVLCQFIICQRTNGMPLGSISAYNADIKSGFVYLSLIVAPEVVGTPVAYDSVILFLNYLFQGWNFRKIYGETSERHAEHLFRSALYKDAVVVEGRLRAHEFAAGKYWDSLIVALYRDDWEEIVARRLPVIRRGLPTV